MKHTSGPWHWWDETDGRPPRYDLATLKGENGHQILTTYGGAGELALGKSPESIANARLIAAAPDLLDALERLVHMAECNTTPGPNTLAQARAAIAKAYGKEDP